jgi:hypothetical protein
MMAPDYWTVTQTMIAVKRAVSRSWMLLKINRLITGQMLKMGALLSMKVMQRAPTQTVGTSNTYTTVLMSNGVTIEKDIPQPKVTIRIPACKTERAVTEIITDDKMQMAEANRSGNITRTPNRRQTRNPSKTKSTRVPRNRDHTYPTMTRRSGSVAVRTKSWMVTLMTSCP